MRNLAADNGHANACCSDTSPKTTTVLPCNACMDISEVYVSLALCSRVSGVSRGSLSLAPRA